MSVSEITRFSPRFYHTPPPARPIDMALPVGEWLARGSVNGDGTGGFATITLITELFPAGPLFLWSVEDLDAFASNASGNLSIEASSQDEVLNEDGTRDDYGVVRGDIPLATTGIRAGVHIFAGSNLQIRKIFQPAKAVPGVTFGTFSVQFGWDTNVNVTVYNARAWGYVWSVRALREPNGPRRPV
ncbi:hypothetical protein LCGC14_2300550 [marine sediment metagenome]|uniref:Uncharacterized protein n=1 Tax=marine sediment metagenome TaxID=412755 RepID=A0A0F9CNK1_9ZZZZ